jgi:hypothetical protein
MVRCHSKRLPEMPPVPIISPFAHHRRRTAEHPPFGDAVVRKPCARCNLLTINHILVEVAGVERSRVLRTRKLLILGTATRAKKAPLPDPLYGYCTKTLFALVLHWLNLKHALKRAPN